jgi:hypothetical protein
MFTLLYGMDYGTILQGIASFIVAIYLVFRRRSTIHNIPGPLSPSWIFGWIVVLMPASRIDNNPLRTYAAIASARRIRRT